MRSLRFTLPEQEFITEEKPLRPALDNMQLLTIVLPVIIGGVINFNLQGTIVFIFLPTCFIISFLLYQRFRSQKDEEAGYNPNTKITKRRIVPAEELVFETTGIYHIVYSTPQSEKNIPWAKIKEIVIGGQYEESGMIYFDNQKFDISRFIQKEFTNAEIDRVVSFVKENSSLKETTKLQYSAGEPYTLYRFIPK
jgi:hypothetical protein